MAIYGSGCGLLSVIAHSKVPDMKIFGLIRSDEAAISRNTVCSTICSAYKHSKKVPKRGIPDNPMMVCWGKSKQHWDRNGCNVPRVVSGTPGSGTTALLAPY